MDIISSLPVEIVEMIFMYLEPKDLARCCAVSRNWYVLANSDRCWCRLCADLNFHGYDSTHLGSCQSTGLQHRWKNLFNNHAKMIQNWGRNKFKVCRMERVGNKIVACSTVHNTMLVIGYENDVIEVYSIKGSKIKFIQQFDEMLDCTDVLLNALVANSKVIAAKFGTGILIYSSVGSNWKFSHLLYSKEEEPKLMYSENKTEVKHFINLMDTLYLRVPPMSVAGDVLFLRTKDGRIYIWDYVKMVCTVSIEVYPYKSIIVYFDERLYLGYSKRLMVYNKNSQIELDFDIKYNINQLLCNKNIILGGMDTGQLCAWERNTGKLIFTRMMKIPYDTMLHPRRDVVFYIVFARGRPSDKVEIRAYDLRTGTICWRTPIPRNVVHILEHTLHMVTERYVIFFRSSFRELRETCMVFDTLNGQCKYSIKIGLNAFLCSDWLLVRQNRNKSTVVHTYS